MNVFLLGFVLALVTYIASDFSYGVPSKVALDFGMGVTTLSAVGIAIFMGVNLISQEIESRTLYMVLSRPISRASFFLGRVLGMILILSLNILILGLMTLFLFFYMGGEFSTLIAFAYLFLIFEAIMVLLIVIFFSLFTNTVISVMNTLVIYIVGHALSGSFDISFIRDNPFILYLLKTYSYFAPDFSKLNIKDFLIYKLTLPMEYLAQVVAYGVFYISLLICINIVIFNKKNFD